MPLDFFFFFFFFEVEEVLAEGEIVRRTFVLEKKAVVEKIIYIMGGTI